MRIFDRYLLRHYFFAFCVTFTSLCGLYIIFHVFANFDEFSEHSAGIGRTLQHMLAFYYPRVILLFDRIAGIVAMMAAVFTLAWTQRQGEITPMLAAGVPIYRVAAPVLLGSLSVSALQVANQEYVIPYYRTQLLRRADDLDGSKPLDVEGAHDRTSGVFFSGRTASPREQAIAEAQLVLPLALCEVITFVRAEKAVYWPAAGDQPSGWELVGVDKPIRVRSEAKDSLYPLPGSNRYFLTSRLTFDQVTRRRQWYQFASTSEVISLLQNPSLGSSPEQAVLVHARIVKPLMNLALLLIALVSAVGRGERNVFVSAGISLLVTSSVVGLVFLSHYLGSAGWLSPALAAWLPVVICGSVATAGLDSVAT